MLKLTNILYIIILTILLCSCSIHSRMTKEFINRFNEGDIYLFDTNIFTQNCIKIKSDSLKFNNFQIKYDSLLKKNTKYNCYIDGTTTKDKNGDDVYKIAFITIPNTLIGFEIEFILEDGIWKINKYRFVRIENLI